MRWLFPLYALLLPFQFALSPVEGVDLALIRIAALGIGAYWLAFSLARRKLFLPSGATVLFFLAFLVFAMSSALWAENSTFALRKGVFLLSFAPLFFVAASWFKESKACILDTTKAFVVGAFILGLGAVGLFFLQFFVGVGNIVAVLTGSILPFFLGTTFGQAVADYPSLLVNISGTTLLRASGIFPDPHMFSYYMGMAFPLALFLAYSETKQRRFWLAVSALLFLADLFSFSRGGYVGLLLGVGVLILSFWHGFSFWRTRQWGFFALGTLVLVVALFGTPFGARLTSIFSQGDGSNVERLRLWKEAVVHITERPLLGVGVGNYPLLVKPGAPYREPIYAHNLYLDLALEVGIVGLLFFCATLLSVFWRLGSIYAVTRDFFPLALIASLTVFVGHSFFETPLFSVHILSALLLLLAIGVSYRHDQTPS